MQLFFPLRAVKKEIQDHKRSLNILNDLNFKMNENFVIFTCIAFSVGEGKSAHGMATFFFRQYDFDCTIYEFYLLWDLYLC